MSRGKRSSSGRDGSQFALLPHVVLDSPAYLSLTYPARSLLLELIRQYRGSNNGRLVLCDKYLEPRGWNSRDVITRAKRQLLDAGLIQETRKGQRPNKAAWFALTWLSLDWSQEMDIARNGFARGAYLKNEKRPPSDGLKRTKIGPGDGQGYTVTRPPNGPMRTGKHLIPRPPDGAYLEVAIYEHDRRTDIGKEGVAITQ